jgi:hypothetical protein
MITKNMWLKRGDVNGWMMCGLWGCLLLASGCAMFSSPSDNQAVVVQTKGGDRKIPVSPVVLQGEVMRYSDEYLASVARVANDVTRIAGTQEIRLEATRWKVYQASAAIGNAAGQNPILSALDMIMLAAASRMVVEDYWMVIVPGDAANIMLETHRTLEAKSWDLVEGWMSETQKQELRDLIVEWRKENPQQRLVTGSNFQEFSESLGRRTKGKMDKTPTSLFGLFGLDPLASLDPAMQEIEKTRQMAERVLYYGQHLPTLLSWQAELLTYQLAVQPETRQVLSNANQFAQSAERLSMTIEQMPQVLDKQREAAIQQVFDNLQKEEKRSRELLSELRSTLALGTEASTNITVLVRAIDALLTPANTVTNGIPVPDEEKGRPFDVTEWSAMLSQAAVAARECNQLMASINTSLPALSGAAEQTSEQFLNQVQRVGLTLIAALLVASLIVIWRIRR